MSALPPSHVYTGFWINWSQGRVLGSTITVPLTAGTLLVAFVALYISFAGKQAWDLFCFGTYIHRARSKKDQDALYWQQQVLLRNIQSPTSLLLEYTRLAGFWRSRTSMPISRSIGVILAALIYSVGITIGGIFSARIVSTSDLTVLASSPACGYFRVFDQIYSKTFLEEIAYRAQATKTQWERANTCYGNGGFSSNCDTYVRDRFNWTSNHHAPCPFPDKSMCTGPGGKALEMDTGVMSSNDDFGINTGKEHRIGLRKRTTCTPLRTDGFLHVKNISDIKWSGPGLPGEQAVILNYAAKNYEESIFAQSTYTSNGTQSYQMQTQYAYAGKSIPSTLAGGTVPQLRRDDGDVIINAIMSNFIFNQEQCDDPVFSAHQKYHFTIFADKQTENTTVYIADQILSPIACFEQYKWCSTDDNDDPNIDSKCTDWAGMHASWKLLPQISPLTEFQHSIIKLFFHQMTLWGTDTQLASSSSDNPFLKAQRLLEVLGEQTGLPDDQWMKEVEGWEALVLSFLQQTVADYATGPSTPYGGYKSIILEPRNEQEKRLCHSQKMRISGGFSNISVLGLSLALSIGGLLILTNLSLSHILTYLHRRKIRKQTTHVFQHHSFPPRYDEEKFDPNNDVNTNRDDTTAGGGIEIMQSWIQDNVLNLQKVAYIGLGYDQGWEDLNEDGGVVDNHGGAINDTNFEDDESANNPTTIQPSNTKKEKQITASTATRNISLPTPTSPSKNNTRTSTKQEQKLKRKNTSAISIPVTRRGVMLPSMSRAVRLEKEKGRGIGRGSDDSEGEGFGARFRESGYGYGYGNSDGNGNGNGNDSGDYDGDGREKGRGSTQFKKNNAFVSVSEGGVL